MNIHSSALLKGSLWMIGLRWSLRGIGLVSTLILARLLTPDDFGLVALSMLAVGLMEVFGQTGQLLALIRHPAPTHAHFDTAWTVSVLMGAAIMAALWTAAPLAAAFFAEPRAEEVVRILSLRALVGGFENVGVVAFRKDLQFGRDFALQLAQRLAVFAVTLGLALAWGDYRALVAGIVAGRVLGVLISYAAHPYRPRPDLSCLGEIWSFSAWMLIMHVAQYGQDKADEFAVGAAFSTAQMGHYNVAADAAVAPTAELVLPMARAQFPVFARLSDRPGELARCWLSTFSILALLCCATGAGMSAVAADFVAVFLGPQWRDAAPLIRWLALSGAAYGLTQAVLTVLSAAGHGRLSAGLSTGRAVLTVAAMAAAAWAGSLETVAQTRFAVSLAVLPGLLAAVARVLPLTSAQVTACLWRPALAAAVMTAVLDRLPLPGPAPLHLALSVGAGALSFGAAVLGLWVLAGRPAGAETAILGKLRRRDLP